MFIYMGMVEQRINEILQIYAYIQTKKKLPLYDAHTGIHLASQQQKGKPDLKEEEKKIMEDI